MSLYIRKQRDQRHLQRHDEQADDHGEQPLPPRELHPGEGVGREGGDEDGDDRGRDRDREGVDERPVDPLAGQHLAVVVEREGGRDGGDEEHPPRAAGSKGSAEAHR
jgi:hypothetical protein